MFQKSFSVFNEVLFKSQYKMNPLFKGLIRVFAGLNSLLINRQDQCSEPRSEHRGCKIIRFPRNRSFIQGSCFEHLQNDCVSYLVIDSLSGESFKLTEWPIKVAQDKMEDQNIFSLANVMMRRSSPLKQLRHKNIVNYECFV